MDALNNCNNENNCKGVYFPVEGSKSSLNEFSDNDGVPVSEKKVKPMDALTKEERKLFNDCNTFDNISVFCFKVSQPEICVLKLHLNCVC